MSKIAQNIFLILLFLVLGIASGILGLDSLQAIRNNPNAYTSSYIFSMILILTSPLFVLVAITIMRKTIKRAFRPHDQS